MQVRIYRPSKTAMQSGRAATRRWVLEADRTARLEPEPLMGWISSADTLNQIKLFFSSSEEAALYARRQGWSFTIDQAHERQIRPKVYADNFRYDRLVPWSH